MSRIAVIDHGAGNLVSIAQGLSRAGANVAVVADPGEIGEAAGIVLPGVGTTGAAMGRLHAAGFVEPLREWNRPLLGICVGLQLFFESSDELGGTDGLGLMAGAVRRLEAAPLLPHIGWNDVATNGHPVFAGIPSGTPFYFVHSYAPEPADPAVVVGTADYGGRFVAAAADGSRIGVQFHPERSGAAGLRLLANFVAIAGADARAA